MSCQLTSLGHFQDISKVKCYLFPHLKEESPERRPKNGKELMTIDMVYKLFEAESDDGRHNVPRDLTQFVMPPGRLALLSDAITTYELLKLPYLLLLYD